MSEAYEWNWPVCVKKAESEGMEIIQTAENRLLVDIDDTESRKCFQRTIGPLRERYNLKEISRWRSKSGEGWHILLECKPLDFVTRIALQAVLGSDRMRESLAMAMHADGQDVSFLFKPNPNPARQNASEDENTTESTAGRAERVGSGA